MPEAVLRRNLERDPETMRGTKTNRQRKENCSLACVLAVALLVAGCGDGVRLNTFISLSGPSFEVTNTFGQLIDAAPGTAAHYLTIQLAGADAALAINTPSSGTIRFFGDLDGLDNCLVLQPKLRAAFNASSLPEAPGLAASDELRFAFCNLDHSGPLEAAITTLYTDRGTDSPAVDAAAFLAAPGGGEPPMLDVWAPPDTESGKPWSALAPATDGNLQVAAFRWVEGARVYVNPTPYLAAITSGPDDTRLRPPTIAEMRLETSPDDTFTSGIQAFDAPDGGPIVPNANLAGHLRAYIRLAQPGDGGSTTPVVAPYEVSYEVREVAGGQVRSHGRFQLNGFSVSDAGDVGEGLYRTAADPAPTSDPSTQDLWLQIPLDPAVVEEGGGVEIRNALDLEALDQSLPLDALDEAARQFPQGDYELEVSVGNAFGSPTHDSQTSSFTIGAPFTVTIVSIDGFGPSPGRVYQDLDPGESFAPRRMYVGNSGTSLAPVAEAPTVVITAQVSPPDAVPQLFWSWYDPDEPAGASPDDADVVDGDNSGGDPSFQPHPPFDFNPANLASVPDAAGMVAVRFTPGTFGGDNFRVGVSPEAGANNTDRYARRAIQTEILTVWKRIILEMPYVMPGTFPVDPAVFDLIDPFLAQLYVEREMVGVGGAIDPTDPAISSFFTSSGRYGPDQPNLGDRVFAVLQTVEDGDDATVALGFVGSRSAALDMIDPSGTNAMSAPLDVANLGSYVFNAVGDLTDDVDETEGNAGSGASIEADGGIMLWIDANVMQTRLSASIPVNQRLARVLVHEIGHHLGLQAGSPVHVHGVGTTTHEIMTANPDLTLGNPAINLFADKINLMHWHDDSGLQVRQDFVPRRQ